MAIDPAFEAVLVAALVGFALSIVLERLMTPCPPFKRPWAAWTLHIGMWSMAYVALTLLSGRPWFALAGVSACLLTLVLVNNAKFKVLREPFVFQDYEYFTDSIRHPRLYLPFLGWRKLLSVAVGFGVAVTLGLWGEEPPAQRFDLGGQLGGLTLLAALSLLCLIAGHLAKLPVSSLPEHDLCTLGFLACLWRYAQESARPLEVTSPFNLLPPIRQENRLPHLVAVQSESFFDPRPLFAGIRQDVLREFDHLKSEAVVYGKLWVPAWGANTVRTEFAFLTGIDEGSLGVHRFNPYWAIATDSVFSLAAYLKQWGYRTICVHPYPASFYQRDRVYPRLGFDELWDICAFDNSQRSGPYIGDVAVAEKISMLLQESTEPMFIFVITMENHGPLHWEKVDEKDVQALYSVPPPAGCEDLTIYLRHLRNADRMIGDLRQALTRCPRPASLCWFGDHVPIMPSVYEILGMPDGDVEYVLWNNQTAINPQERKLHAHTLAVSWLRAAELIV